MKLTYTQKDIERAIRNDLVAKGFPMHNQTLGFDFSMGRKDNGLNVVLNIDEIEIPGFSDGSPVSAPVPAAAVIQPVSAVGEEPQETTLAPATMQEVAQAGVATLALASTTAPAPEVVAEAAPATAAVAEVPAAVPATSTKSLFGNTPAA